MNIAKPMWDVAKQMDIIIVHTKHKYTSTCSPKINLIVILILLTHYFE